MTKMILFVRTNFFLIYFLVSVGSEARTLLDEQKVVKSSYGRPVPLPPTPESASPSNQERVKRHAHLPPPAPKHGPKIDQVTTSTSRHGRESSELLMTITSNVISDNPLLILLPSSSSSDSQERFEKHTSTHLPKPADHEQGQIIVTSSNCQDHDHVNSNNYGREEKIVSPPTPKPADEEGQIIITSSTTTTTYDDQNSNYMGKDKERKLTPPSPHHNAPIDQLSSRRHGRGQGLKPHKYPISSLPFQASY